jgi:predicted  nucleic acid-binding Zn-ribbon protein
MTEILTNPAILALIGTIFGGAGLKFIEHWLSRAKTRDDTAVQIRNELRTELARLKEDIAKMNEHVNAAEAEADGWRAKYYAREEEYYQVKRELQAALAKIKENAEKAVQQITRDDAEPS